MMRRSGQQGVPVIDIGGRIVVGFDRSKINQLLGLK
jgi:glutaredoxin 3